IQSGLRASLAQIVQIVGPRLDLSDYAAYNLPKEILQHATHLNVSQKQSVRVSNVSNTTKHDNG
ncbi:unnamed protein product, partial [Adineta steineri]